MSPVQQSNDYSLHCAFFDAVQCDPDKGPCASEEKCRSEKRSCFTVWNSRDGKEKVKLQGCWSQDDCVSDKECVSYQEEKYGKQNDLPPTYFCCCRESMCNSNFKFDPSARRKPDVTQNTHPRPRTNATHPSTPTHAPPSFDNAFNSVVLALVPVFAAAILIVVGYYIYRRYCAESCRRHRHLSSSQQAVIGSKACPLVSVNGSLHQNGGCKIPSALEQSRPVQLIEAKARGRFGYIWRAWMAGSTPDAPQREVAVKIFPESEVESWMHEQDIYNIPFMRGGSHRTQEPHPNILHFIMACSHQSTSQSGALVREYWIVTAYIQSGSLYDFLKANTVTPENVLRIAHSALRGLAFLHCEVASSTDYYKPPVVHRDFKSKNVLLKPDLTACIADFGLALKCDRDQELGNSKGQVGTRRYMAPEVLEGASDFSAFAFKQIDVYAAALVLWELMLRCQQTPGSVVAPHRLPFEEWVGTQPTLDAMQRCVLVENRRPPVEPSWTVSPDLAVVCLTIEEMWDSEPDARVTSDGAMERIARLTNSSTSLYQNGHATPAADRQASEQERLLDQQQQVQPPNGHLRV